MTISEEQYEQLNRKLDYIVERQRFIEEFIDEMTPVGREAVGVASTWLADLEAQGAFETGSDAMMLANEMLDVLRNADSLHGVGPFGMFRATHEPDVQRGLAIAFEMLRRLGRAQLAGGPGTALAVVGRSYPTAPASVATPKPMPAPAESCPAPAPSTERVEWEGRTFDGNGFLVDPNDWDEDLAVKMAKGLGVELTDEHWHVVKWARHDYLTTGASPNVRRVAVGSGVGVQRMYELFHTSPGKTTSLIAGIPKPAGCI